jgi:hypothetical protein
MSSLIPARLFPAHLLPYNPGEHAPAFGLQQGFRVKTPKQVQEGSDQSSPARLVAGPEPGAVVPVEIFVKENQIAPVRIVLELGRPAIDWPLPIGIAQKRAHQPADQLLRHFEQRR